MRINDLISAAVSLASGSASPETAASSGGAPGTEAGSVGLAGFPSQFEGPNGLGGLLRNVADGVEAGVQAPSFLDLPGDLVETVAGLLSGVSQQGAPEALGAAIGTTSPGLLQELATAIAMPGGEAQGG
jgi:hypothetical protein